ncbi:hypothetical protein [Christensenella minuta]|uniref:hypothetical protein n=1 Tax=Christensenella minuta TaxID=626937 RepID=UPI0021573DBC|nr:hypothetical protein [Christensenella minuta]
MASTIKGITVEIGGNTQPLNKSLQNVNKTARDLGSELRIIDKLLKLDPTNTTLLAQKQKVLAESISNTEKKLKTLKIAQEQAQAQLSKGEIGEDQYRALERQVVTTEQSLESLKSEAREVDSALEQAGNESQEAAGKVGTFGSETKKAASESSGFSAKTVAVFTAVAAAVGAAIAKISEIVGKIKEAATAAAAYSDDINTMAAQYRISTESLQRFAYAADIVDVSVETFGSSLGRLTKNIGNAQKGTKDQVDAFDALGVSIYDSNGKLRDSEDVFYDVIDALGKFEDETQADVYASRLFGRSFQDLNPLVTAGTDRLRELGDEAQTVGAVMGQDALDSANAFQDSLDRMNQLTQVATRAFSSGMAPALDRITVSINEKLASPDTQRKLEKMGEAIGAIAEAFMNFAMFVVDNGEIILKVIGSIAAGFAAWKIASIIQSMGGLKKAVLSVIPAIKNMKNSINALSSSTIIGALVTIATIIASIAEACLGASDATEDFKDRMSSLKDETEGMSTEFAKTQEAIALNGDAMRGLVDDIQQLDAMIKSGSLSSAELAAAQGQLAAKTAQYNAAAGEQVLKIDEATGAIDGSTSALAENTEALIENAKKAAQIEALQKAFEAQTEAQAQQAAQLAEIDKYYDQLSDEQKKYIDQMKEEGVSVEALSDLWYASPIWGGQVNNEIRGIVEGLEDSVDAKKAAGAQAEYYSKVIGESAEADAKRKEALDTTTESLAMLTEQETLYLLRAQENGKTLSEEQAAQLEAYRANNEAQYASLEELVKKEQELQQKRLEILTNSNDAINYEDQISLKERIDNINANAQAVTDYEKGLATLRLQASSQANEDVKTNMLSYIETLGDYSKESMGIVSQMVSDFETGGGDMAWGLANAYGGALNKAKSGMQSKTYSVGADTEKSGGEGIASSDSMQDEATIQMNDTVQSMRGIIDSGNFYYLGMGIINDIKRGMQQAAENLYRVANEIISTLKSKFDFNVSVEGTGSGARVRGFATGGIISREQIVRVAERGPEAIIPLDRLGGIIQGVLDNNGGGNGGNTYQLNVYTSDLSDGAQVRLFKNFSRWAGRRI